VEYDIQKIDYANAPIPRLSASATHHRLRGYPPFRLVVTETPVRVRQLLQLGHKIGNDAIGGTNKACWIGGQHRLRRNLGIF